MKNRAVDATRSVRPTGDTFINTKVQNAREKRTPRRDEESVSEFRESITRSSLLSSLFTRPVSVRLCTAARRWWRPPGRSRRCSPTPPRSRRSRARRLVLLLARRPPPVEERLRERVERFGVSPLPGPTPLHDARGAPHHLLGERARRTHQPGGGDAGEEEQRRRAQVPPRDAQHQHEAGRRIVEEELSQRPHVQLYVRVRAVHVGHRVRAPRRARARREGGSNRHEGRIPRLGARDEHRQRNDVRLAREVEDVQRPLDEQFQKSELVRRVLHRHRSRGVRDQIPAPVQQLARDLERPCDLAVVFRVGQNQLDAHVVRRVRSDDAVRAKGRGRYRFFRGRAREPLDRLHALRRHERRDRRRGGPREVQEELLVRRARAARHDEPPKREHQRERHREQDGGDHRAHGGAHRGGLREVGELRTMARRRVGVRGQRASAWSRRQEGRVRGGTGIARRAIRSGRGRRRKHEKRATRTLTCTTSQLPSLTAAYRVVCAARIDRRFTGTPRFMASDARRRPARGRCGTFALRHDFFHAGRPKRRSTARLAPPSPARPTLSLWATTLCPKLR